MPMMLHVGELPGPFSLHSLAGAGMVCRLDSDHAYCSSHASSVRGRARIVKHLTPHGVISCGLTAGWVWIGGNFPESIDIVSSSHFRSLMFGRRIRVFNRQTPEQQCLVLEGLRITTPLRTACDIALLPEREFQASRGSHTIARLMKEYSLTPAQCLSLLRLNRFWPNTPQARQYFEGLPAHAA